MDHPAIVITAGTDTIVGIAQKENKPLPAFMEPFVPCGNLRLLKTTVLGLSGTRSNQLSYASEPVIPQHGGRLSNPPRLAKKPGPFPMPVA